MSRILEALEKASREQGNAAGPATGQVFAFPHTASRLTLPAKVLRACGWVSALPTPPPETKPFRRLGHELLNRLGHPMRVAVVGTGHPCGATTVSLNLATELARAGVRPVLWVGSPSGSPWIGTVLRRWARSGLANMAAHGAPLVEARVPGPIPGLSLLPGAVATPVACPPPDRLADTLLGLCTSLPEESIVVDLDDPDEAPGVLEAMDGVVVVLCPGTRVDVLEDHWRHRLAAARACAAIVNHLPRRPRRTA